MVEILCFQHCDSKAFCIDRLPDECPMCGAALANSHLKLPLFRVPNPFTSLHCSGDKTAVAISSRGASRAQCKVVIRPSFGTGDFLHDYNSKGNLHIGVTDSRGDVFEYDTDGLHCGDRTDQWSQCIVVDLELGDYASDPDWLEYWDHTLLATIKGDRRWSADLYSEDSRNCFSFVLEFLVHLRHYPLSNRAKNKVEFVRQYVVPKTSQAGKFITLYRKLKSNAREGQGMVFGSVTGAAADK